ncbi:MAG: hypothetical protein CENE_00391 [Candidatus Celerinatantimonas neptuna]|nr:MAG: hypothetical protein CENE_00391 [Candidatus Celerinatantimonas neptuna]
MRLKLHYWLFIIVCVVPMVQATQLSEFDFHKLQQVQHLLDNGHIQKAKNLLNKWLQSTGKQSRQDYASTLGHIKLGRIAIIQNTPKPALNQFLKAYQTGLLDNHQQSQLLLTIAQLHLNLGQWQSGVNKLNLWLHQTPRQNHIALQYYQLAIGYYHLKSWKKGLASIRMALLEQDSPHISWYQLAVALATSDKKWPRAIQWQQKIIESAPQKMTHWEQLASLEIQGQHMKAALATMRLAWQRQLFDHPRNYQLLAQLAIHEKIPYLAAQALESAINKRMLKATPANLRQIAQLLIQARSDRKAVAFYKKIIQKTDKPSDYQQYMSLLLNQNRWHTALNAYQQALAKHITSPQLHLIAGIAAIKTGSYIKARQYLFLAQNTPAFKSSSRAWLQYLKQIQQAN